jgi:hypothetical protein
MTIIGLFVNILAEYGRYIGQFSHPFASNENTEVTYNQLVIGNTDR